MEQVYIDKDGYLKLRARERIPDKTWKKVAFVLFGAFPDLEREFLRVLRLIVERLEFGEKRLKYAVWEVVRTCRRLPRIADFIEPFDFRIKVYEYQEVIDYLAGKYGADWVNEVHQFKRFNTRFILGKDYEKIKKFIDEKEIENFLLQEGTSKEIRRGFLPVGKME